MKLTRRKFLWTAGVAGIGGAGLVVGYSLTRKGPVPIAAKPGGLVPSAFLQITPDNTVRFYCPRDEMGQGITTGLATLIGEELDVNPVDLVVEFAGVHADYANPEFGVQATGGSTSMHGHFLPLRQVAADVRALIVNAAVADLNLMPKQIKTDSAHVLTNGERYPYGRFIATARTLALPSDTPLKPRAQWRYIGKTFPRIDGVAKSTGTATFGIDIDIPGMHRAVVKRCPVAGGTVHEFSADSVLHMPGVTNVVPLPSGVAVVATQFWQAKKASDALSVTWDLPELAKVNTAQIKADYASALAQDEGETTAEQGDLTQGFAAAEHVVENDYWTPYLAHAPMEPMNAVVRIEDGWVDVWAGTQGALGAQGLVARHLGISREQVRVHSQYLGGAFGRRATLAHVVEAAQIARESGKPVQLIWTREDDIRNGVFRPASLMRIKAAVKADGTLSAWQAKRVGGNILPSMLSTALPAFLPTAIPAGALKWASKAADKAVTDWTVDSTSVEGLFGDYDVSNQEIRHVTRDHGLPLSFWRSVGHSYTAFAKESAIDELAHSAGIDPVNMRLENVTTNVNLKNVIRIAGEHMQQMTPQAGHGLGLAAHSSFLSHVAQVADVSVQDGVLKVHKILCVIDCGQVINPDVVRAQMEGSIMYGLTAALHGNLELVDGAIKESNFHDYPILRMNEAPQVEVIIVDSDEPPTGVGEPGLPPVAPAVANAIFAATGQRLRSLPFQLA